MVDVAALRSAVSREVGAPIAEVYAAVADLTQMGRWSPECTGGDWLDGADRAEPGARLRGRNRFRWMRWSRTVEVTVADEPHTLEFRTLPGPILRDSSLWRYRFEPVTPTTTLVTESFQALRGPSWFIRAIDAAAARDWADPTPGMRTTLERLDRALAGDDGRPVPADTTAPSSDRNQMRTFDNPVMGDTIEILDEGDPDSGRPIEARITLAPHAQGPPLHHHPRLHERYEVIQGTGGIQVGADRLELSPGDAVDIPPRTRHRFWNPTDEPVVLAAQVRPPSPRFLDFLDSLYGLARDGLTDDTGRPSPLRAALIFHTYRDEVVPADPPVAVQRLAFPVLAAAARARGYRT